MTFLTAAEKKLVGIFCLWRLALMLVAILASIFLPFRPEFAYTQFSAWSKDPWLQNSLINPWASFDGVHYLLIVKNGYDNEARFFPLYPLLIRGVNFLTSIPHNWVHADFILVIIGLLISHLAFVSALLILRRLLMIDYSEKIAFWTCLFCLFFPTSFFFVSVYSESLFLFLAVSAFWLARKQKWLAAALCAALLSATRLVGIVMWPILLIELAQQNNFRISTIKSNWRSALSLLISPLGLISFAIYNWHKWGRWDTFLLQQGDLGNSRSINTFVDPIRVVFRYGKILTTISSHQYVWWVGLIELISFAIGVILLLVAWKQKVRLTYLLYAIGCFFVPVLSGTLSGLPRYVMIIFPFWLVLGMIESKILRYGLFAIGAISGVLLVALFTRGYFIA